MTELQREVQEEFKELMNEFLPDFENATSEEKQEILIGLKELVDQLSNLYNQLSEE